MTSSPKLEAVKALLADATWFGRANGWIAEYLQVDKKTVALARHKVEQGGIHASSPPIYLEAKDGRRFTYTHPPVVNADPIRAALLKAFGPSDPNDWWDCPLCNTTFSRDGAEQNGWVARRFCGRCEYRGVEHELGGEPSC